MSPAYLRVLVRPASVLLALKRGEAYLLHAWLRELEERLHTYMHTYLTGRDDRVMGIFKGEVDKNRPSKHHRMQQLTGHALVLPLIMCALMGSAACRRVSQLQFWKSAQLGAQMVTSAITWPLFLSPADCFPDIRRHNGTICGLHAPDDSKSACRQYVHSICPSNRCCFATLLLYCALSGHHAQDAALPLDSPIKGQACY